MIPKNEIVALRTGHKGEELITSVCSHRVSYIVALKKNKQFDSSRVIVALQEHSCLSSVIFALNKHPDPSSVIFALSVSYIRPLSHGRSAPTEIADRRRSFDIATSLTFAFRQLRLATHEIIHDNVWGYATRKASPWENAGVVGTDICGAVLNMASR